MKIKYYIIGFLILFTLSLTTGMVISYNTVQKDNVKLTNELSVIKRYNKQCEHSYDSITKIHSKLKKDYMELESDYTKLKKRRSK